jgi:DNA-binding transcriptional ArsR family regulator
LITTTKAAKQFKKNAPIFATLGDETRVALLLHLGESSRCSVTQLSEGRPPTRQAICMHLCVLEDVKLVRGLRRGREHLFKIEPKTLENAAQSLEAISHQCDGVLVRLKNFVEVAVP